MGNWCEELYRAKADGLVLYGRALGLSQSEAEDVLQELFVCLLRREEAPSQPDHYCVRAFRNRALNHHRGLWRRLLCELESARWFEPARQESPWERVLMTALAGLPPAQKEVIVLKIWHRYTFEEIAGVLDESPNTVAGRYRYGLQKLRNHLPSFDYERLDLDRDPLGFMEAPPRVAPRC